MGVEMQDFASEIFLCSWSRKLTKLRLRNGSDVTTVVLEVQAI